jgi:hypothetical protein
MLLAESVNFARGASHLRLRERILSDVSLGLTDEAAEMLLIEPAVHGVIPTSLFQIKLMLVDVYGRLIALGIRALSMFAVASID